MSLPGFTADRTAYKTIRNYGTKSENQAQNGVTAQWCPSWIPGCTCKSRCSLAAAGCYAAGGGPACAVAKIACDAYCDS